MGQLESSTTAQDVQGCIPDVAGLYTAYQNLAQSIVGEQQHTPQLQAPGMPMREDVDTGMRFEDIQFEQSQGGGLLGVGAVGSVYRATYKVGE
jgi:hypothetical protein